MTKIIALSGLLSLAGCYSIADQASQACAQLGFGPGSEQYWTCMEHEEPAIAADRDRYSAMTAAGLYMMSQPTPRYVIVPGRW